MALVGSSNGKLVVFVIGAVEGEDIVLKTLGILKVIKLLHI